jgi:hypothetical protein
MIKASEANQAQVIIVTSAMARLRYNPKPRPRSAELTLDAERTEPPSGAR